MEKLGIDISLLLTQIINFVIMIFVLQRLLYKPILKSLEERKKKIEAGLAYSEKMAQVEAKLAGKREEILNDARDEAKVILENAKKDAKQVGEEIIAHGKQELAQMRVKLDTEMRQKLAELTQKVTAHTVNIASEMVKRLLGDILTSEEQHKFILKQLQKIESQHEK